MRKYILVSLVSMIIGGFVATLLNDQVDRNQAVAQPPTPRSAGSAFPPTTRGGTVDRADSSQSPLTPDELTNIKVYESCNRSVVNITTRTVRPDVFFMLDAPAEGAGSGSVLDKRGHILTNYHVVEGARQIVVALHDNTSYEAQLVGRDELNDIAVLRIEAPPVSLYPVKPGDSSGLRVGQKVLAIGNPFGLERTMTVGIISSLNRSLPSRSSRAMKSMIQIDAALNRGNSGGPLFDSGGELIGMNTAIASKVGENSGVGFSIPVNTVRRVVPQLIENGRVIRPDIGITRAFTARDGLGIATLTPGGAADRAGLRGFRLVKRQKRRGPFVYEETRIDRSYADIITQVDRQDIETADDLLTAIEKHQPGDTVVVTILRDGQEMDVQVRLDEAEQ